MIIKHKCDKAKHSFWGIFIKYSIYIKKNIKNNEDAYFYLKLVLKNKTLFFEIGDYEINLLDINENKINKNYISLKDFIEESKFVGRKIKDTKDVVLYSYNDNIDMIKCRDDIFLEPFKIRIVSRNINYEVYDYKDIEARILEQIGEILKYSYLSVIDETTNYLKRKDSLSVMLNSLDLYQLDKETYYKYILNIEDKDDLNIIKKKAFVYLKNVVESIKNNALKNKMTDDALDAYNYFEKKLSKVKLHQ